MKELLVSIHNMMQQIVANTGSGQVVSGVSSSVSSAPDSYGNPVASPITGTSQVNSGSAPDSYGTPLASPISGSRPATSSPVPALASYGGPLSSGGGSGGGVGGAYSSSSSDPVIKSTLEQLTKALRQYRDTKTGLDERSLLEGEKSHILPYFYHILYYREEASEVPQESIFQ